MNNIIYDDEIITPKGDKWKYYYNFLNKLDKKDCVKCALFCAKIVNNNSKENNDCIELVEKWLIDDKSVNRQELYYVSVATAAYTAAAYATAATAATAYAYATAATAATAASNYIYIYSDNHAANAVVYAVNSNAASCNITITNDINLYIQTLLRTTKQYNTINHNNQHYEFILKEIIKEDIDNLTDADYNMLIDLSQEYYNINPNITNKRIFIELLRKEYE